VEREAAQAISETELLTSEPTTVVLSRLGWVRAAKGHDIDVRSLSYKSGDSSRPPPAAATCNKPCSSIRRAGLQPGCPPAAGRARLGEPLSGTVDPPDGATFAAVLIGDPDDLWLLASDAGYEFAVKLRELYAATRRASRYSSPENARFCRRSRSQIRPRSPFSSTTAAKYCAATAQIEEMTAARTESIGIPGKKSRTATSTWSRWR